MKLFLTITAICLLVFNGAGAIFGGWHLMNHPDGSSLQMTPDYLQYSPFDDYLVPGIILFIFNGLFSLVVLASLLFQYRYAPVLVAMQGAILTGWIIIQILMVHMIYYLHFILGGAGVLLIIFGYALGRFQKRKHA